MLRLGPIAKRVLCGCVGASVLLLALCCRAQQDQKPVFTLKVYANLVQVPTLVLDHDRQPLRKIDPSRLRVSLDGGKKFPPTRVRMEGDDPLDLAILLDMSGSQRHLIGSFADALGRMAADSLHPEDRVSVYALNCHLIASGRELLPRPDLLSKSVETALKAPALDEGYSHGSCAKPFSVWDAMMAVVHDMAGSHARQAMLVVSEGETPGFQSWTNLHLYAAAAGVALFGMNDGFSFRFDPMNPSRVGDPLQHLCESTGGLVMHSQRSDLEDQLDKWIAMLRNRYIVAFPRPQHLSVGAHDIQISLKGDVLAFVTMSGVSFTLPDPKLTSDPNYLPSKAGENIPVGNKRPPQ